MKKSLSLTLILVLIGITVFAQEPAKKDTCYWTSSGNIGLNISQSYLSNWAAGGENAINGLGLFNYEQNYLKGKTKWDNNLSMALGYSILGENAAIKTDDRIELNSIYGYKATEKLFYSLAFSFKSQFANGYNYSVDSTNRISGFLIPAYITLGVGMEWTPSPKFSLNVSPATLRLTVVNDQDLADAGAFGVDPAEYDSIGNVVTAGKKTRYEIGAKVVAQLNIPLFENVSFDSKLELFSNYLKNPQNVDVDWQNLITMKVNKWLNANISAHLIYDDDIMILDKDGKTGPRLQFKEVLSIGLSYKFR